MSKDLSTLIRLYQYRLDEKRRLLGALMSEIGKLEKSGKLLEKEIISEQRTASSYSDSFGMFYGEYAINAVERREQLAQEISILEERITIAQKEMQTEYKSLKTFEITQESRADLIAEEFEKKEQTFLDEVGQETHRRHK